MSRFSLVRLELQLVELFLQVVDLVVSLEQVVFVLKDDIVGSLGLARLRGLSRRFASPLELVDFGLQAFCIEFKLLLDLVSSAAYPDMISDLSLQSLKVHFILRLLTSFRVRDVALELDFSLSEKVQDVPHQNQSIILVFFLSLVFLLGLFLEEDLE